MTLDLVTTAPSEGQSRVTEEHRRIFAADGVVKIEGAVDSQWTSRLLALADDRLAHPGKWVGDSAASGSAGRVFTERYLWRDNATVKDFVFGSGVAALAGEVMGVSQVRFYFDHLLVKEPGGCGTASIVDLVRAPSETRRDGRRHAVEKPVSVRLRRRGNAKGGVVLLEAVCEPAAVVGSGAARPD